MIADTGVSSGTDDANADPGMTTAEFEDVAAVVSDTKWQGETLEEPG